MSRGVMNCRCARWCRAAWRCAAGSASIHVQRGADRVIADGVEVELESRGGQPPGGFPQRLRIDEQAALVAGGPSVPVQVGGGHGGGERLSMILAVTMPCSG